MANEIYSKTLDCKFQAVTPNEASIIWADYAEVFAHETSGMCYSPEGKTFLKWVSEEYDDYRVLYYRPSEDIFFLIDDGHLGEENRKVLIDKTWDRSTNYLRKSP